MAIKLTDKTNIIAPDSDYPYGRTKDNTGSNDGTPYNERTNGDYFQFFERLMVQGAQTHNDLPENAYSGFQFNEALKYLIIGKGVWADINLSGTAFDHADPSAGYFRAQFRVDFTRSIIEFRGVLQHDDFSPAFPPQSVGNITTGLTFDKRSRLNAVVFQSIDGTGLNTRTAVVSITLTQSGDLVIQTDSLVAGTEYLCLDGCSVSFRLVDDLTTT